MVRRDYEYVFERILNESFNRWYYMKKYFYKNIIFDNYISFLIEYATEYNSIKSKNLIMNKSTSILGIKRHKKTKVFFNRWKN